jgi:predicted nuclease with TOPRIM domain
MGPEAGGEELAQALIRRTEEDEAFFERLRALCGQELGCLARPGLEGMEEVLAEKEGLMRRLDERAAEAAPLWDRLRNGEGEGGRMPDLERRMDRIRAKIGEIQRLEAEIARHIGDRRKDARASVSSLGRVNLAMDAYRPSRVYDPRFVDRKE